MFETKHFSLNHIKPTEEQQTSFCVFVCVKVTDPHLKVAYFSPLMLIVGSLKDADDLVTFLELDTEIFSEVPVFLNLPRETAHLLVPQTALCSERVKMINGSHNPILHVDFSSMNDYMEDNETNSSLGERNSLGCVQILIPQELFLALGLISLVENILVVMAIIKNRNLHSPMYYFICCLAVSDMLVSVSNVVETIFMLLNDHGLLDVHPGMLRHLDNIIDVMICSSVVSSLSFLCTIAADRYITIFYALRYHSIMTTQRATAIIVVVWLASITSSILFIVYHTDNAVIVCLVTFFCTTLVFNAVLYLHMFLLAHVHSRRIVAFNKSRRQSTSMKGAITLTILLGVFIVCWGPFFLHLILILTCPTSPFCNCFFRNFNLFLILIICNSLIDPLIYAYRSQELRKTLQELILCSWCFGV